MFEKEDYAVRPCVFCGEIKIYSSIKGDKYHYNCPRCGKYEYLSSDHSKIMKILNKKKQEIDFNLDEREIFRTYCSYVMHAKHFDKEDVEVHVTPQFAESLTKEYRAFDVLEQRDNFLYWLCSNSLDTGEDLDVLYESSDDSLFRFYDSIFSWFGCTSLDNLLNVIEMSKQNGFLWHNQRNYADFYAPTFKAYELYEQLKKGKKATNKAFLALQFDGALNEKRKKKLKKAVSQTGFILNTVDEEPKAGLIDDKIRLDIRNSRFVIADLTDGNKGAYWEAGFAEGMGKSVIYMCREDVFNDEKKRPHFDVSHHQCITWSKDKFDEAMEKLKNTIRYTFPDAIQEDAEEE